MLTRRLREQAEWHSDGHGALHKEAADEIERLLAKNRELASTLATRLLDTTKNDEIERLTRKLTEIHEMSQDHLAPAWQVIENIAATAKSAALTRKNGDRTDSATAQPVA